MGCSAMFRRVEFVPAIVAVFFSTAYLTLMFHRLHFSRIDETTEAHLELSERFPVTTSVYRLNSSRIDETDEAQLELNERFPVTTSVYYFWCSGGRVDRRFEYRHHLSVLSAIKYLRPDVIFFYYDTKPKADSKYYHTWHAEIVDQFPFFHSRQMAALTKKCKSTGVNLPFVEQTLMKNDGGIYIREDVVLTKHSAWMWKYDSLSVVDDANKTVVRSLAAGFDKNHCKREVIRVTLARVQKLVPDEQMQAHNAVADICHNSRNMSTSLMIDHIGSLAIIDNSIFPRDIWELDTQCGRDLRTIVYNKTDVARATPSFDQLVPNIAHLVWIGGEQMDFMFYLTVLSLLNVAHVDKVFIHGDKPPHGLYWNLVRNDSRVKTIRRYVGYAVYGATVNGRSHMSDVWRVEFMIRYGGIYSDVDAIFLRPPGRELRGYDAVASYDILSEPSAPFPDIINFGVSLGKRNAPFWRRFQSTMKYFRANEHVFNGLQQPYKVKERYPELLHIDSHLQVICFESKCHPTWWADYKTYNVNHVTQPGKLNWTTDAVAFHWTHPTPSEFTSARKLLESTGMFAEIGHYVLRKSGMFDFFKNLPRNSGY